MVGQNADIMNYRYRLRLKKIKASNKEESRETAPNIQRPRVARSYCIFATPSNGGHFTPKEKIGIHDGIKTNEVTNYQFGGLGGGGVFNPLLCPDTDMPFT